MDLPGMRRPVPAGRRGTRPQGLVMVTGHMVLREIPGRARRS
jgi:hypothetical protein